MSTSHNRQSTVGWIRKGFNAGNQKALDNLVHKSERKYLRVQTSTLSKSTALPSKEEPINIMVFDGGGMKGRDSQAMFLYDLSLVYNL